MLKSLLPFTLIVCCSISLAQAANILSTSEQIQLLHTHAKWRQSVGLPALRWSEDLAESAQEWADTLKARQGCKMVHSHAEEVGENLFWASAEIFPNGKRKLQAVKATEVIDMFGNEYKDYDYRTDTCASGKKCGHYTQVVWKGTQAVGCAKAICRDLSQVWVCHYDPPGNYIGVKPY